MTSARELTNGYWAVDDGEGPLLVECPCCGKRLTEAAARAIITKIEHGEGSLRGFRELAALLRNPESRPPS